jgi:hypothetical protein
MRSIKFTLLAKSDCRAYHVLPCNFDIAEGDSAVSAGDLSVNGIPAASDHCA